jgi:predicted nucleotidyltransferase
MPARSGSPRLLPLLRSETQARVLEALILHPDRASTVAQLAGTLGVTDMSVRRELHRMVDAGIIEREPVGRVGLFRASTASPLYEPLRELLERSVGLEALLRDALLDFPGVETAVIYGSWAREEAHAESDVDVLVLGDVDYGDLVARLSELQERVGREINVVAMRPDELRHRLDQGSGFVRDVIASPVKLLVGDIEPVLRDAAG